MKDGQKAEPGVRGRLVFHCVGYGLTMLLAVSMLYLGVMREDWERDTRITLGIGGAGLAFGGTVVMVGILYRLWKERHDG